MTEKKRAEKSISPEQKPDQTPTDKDEKDDDFKPISEIEFKFLLRDAETISEGLTKFAQTSEAHDDGVPCNDIVAKYLKSSPNCEELLAVLDKGDTPLKASTISLVFKCLEQILTRIRVDIPKSLSVGEAIAQKILVIHMGKVYKCLQAGNKSNIIKATLQLLISLVMLSEKSKKAVQTRLNFSHVHFAAFFKRRNRKDPEDVRSCMVLLTMAFLVNSENSIVTSLVQQKTFLQMVISGLKFDAKEIVVDVLSTLSDKVVKNISISKTDKVKLFSEVMLRQLSDLYTWLGPDAWSPDGRGKNSEGVEAAPGTAPEDDAAIVADVVDTFLQDLCCSHKCGISFYDKTVGTGPRSQNQLLSHFVAYLYKSMEDQRKASLMMNILVASPDLLSSTLSEMHASLEPRWSDRWGRLLDWLVALYSAMPDTPQFLSEKGKKVYNEHSVVAMATVFCVPPPKVLSALAQSLRHDDVRVRHSYLELVQVLTKKACAIQYGLMGWVSELGQSKINAESLRELFSTTVLKALPPLSQLFVCADKVLALTSLTDSTGKEVKDAIEQKLCVDLGQHLSALLQVFCLYQRLTPSLLSQRARDVSKLIQAVTDHLAQQTESGSVLPQLYLLQLLSETDPRTFSLAREGVLEKLLLSARHNKKYVDLTVDLICKMLTSLELFSGHGDELKIWLRNALDSDTTNKEQHNMTNNEENNETPKKKKNNVKKASSTPGTETAETMVKPVAQDNQGSVVSFLSRCISTLMNNPAPYVDQVMSCVAESWADDDTQEERMDVSVDDTSSSAVEAILAMDEAELDRMVASTIAPSTNESEVNKTASTQLPMSPLVLVASEQLHSNQKVGPESTAYVSRVLLELFHLLPQRLPLVHVVVKSGFTTHLSGGLVGYLQSWTPGQNQQKQETAKLEPPVCGTVTSMVMTVRNHGDDTLDLSSPSQRHQWWSRCKPQFQQLKPAESLVCLGQVLLYMGEVVKVGVQTTDRLAKLQMYRNMVETLIELVLAKEEETSNNTDTDTNDDDTRVAELVSSLKSSNESIASIAVKQVLSNPDLLQVVWDSTITATPSRKKTKLTTETSDEHDIVFNVVALFEHVFKTSIQNSWLQGETGIISKHADFNTSVILAKSGLIQQTLKTPKKKLKKKRESSVVEESESTNRLSCVEILRVLSPHLEIPDLTKCITRLVLCPSQQLVYDENEGEDPNTMFTDVGKLVLELMDRWASVTSAKLSPAGLDVLLKRGKQLGGGKQKQSVTKMEDRFNDSHSHHLSKSQSDDDALLPSLRIKLAPTFKELCGLTPSEFEPFFKLVLSVKSKVLQECATNILSKVPQMVTVFSSCVPEELLSSPIKLAARVGRGLAALLVRSEPRVWSSVDAWLQTNAKKIIQKDIWWLINAFLDGREDVGDVSQKSINMLKEGCAKSLPTILSSANGDVDPLLALRKICDGVKNSDISFQAAVISATRDVIKTSATGVVSRGHFDLLLTCSEFCHTVNDLSTVTLTLDLTLQQLSRVAASKQQDETWVKYLLSLAEDLVNKCSDFKPLLSYWDSLVKNTLRTMYKNPQLLHLLAMLAPKVYQTSQKHPELTTSLTAHTTFQMCSSHTAFFPTMMGGEFPLAKSGVVELLYTLAQIEPACYNKQISKVLVGAYGATLSLTDQRLLHMIKRVSCDKDGKFDCPLLWGKRVMDHHSVSKALGSSLHRETSVADVLAQLDGKLLHRSMTNFPLQLTLDSHPEAIDKQDKTREECYDPRFLLRLLAQLLTPDKQVPLHQFVEKGCLGYLLVALSSHSLHCRLLAYNALNDLHQHAEGSRWAERAEVGFLLDLINAGRSQDGQKLSLVVSLFFARVVKLFLHPSDPLYMPIFRFLVARPEIDLRSVPEFYKLFFSPGTNYKQERNWTLSLLAEGLRESSDYWLYQKKSIFRIIMAFYTSSISDVTSQTLVLSIIQAACRDKSVAVHLVKSHKLLAWLAAVASQLETNDEHAEKLCEIVHALWVSLTSYQHLGAEKAKTGSSVATGKTDASQLEASDDEDDESHDEEEKENEDDENSSDDDDESIDEEEEKSNEEMDESSENEEEEEKENKSSRKRKMPSNKTVKAFKKQKLSDNSSKCESKKAVTNQATDSTKRPGTSTAPSVPKSTVVELCLVVKNLIWHIRFLPVPTVAKVLEVLHWLVAHESSAEQENTAQSTQEERSTPHLQSDATNKLVTLTAREACLVLHRLGSAAELQAVVEGVESSLRSEGIYTDTVLSAGASRVVGVKAGGLGKRDEKDGVMGGDLEESNDEDKGDRSGVLDESVLVEKDGRVVSDMDVEDEREKALELLCKFEAIVSRTGCLQFV